MEENDDGAEKPGSGASEDDRLSGSDADDRLSGSDADNESDDAEDSPEKSGMASVIARILSKDISKSSRVLLAKGKTNREIQHDIEKRKRIREEAEQDPSKPAKKVAKAESKESESFKEEKVIQLCQEIYRFNVD